MKQITLEIRPNGILHAQTHGVKGKACLAYIDILEKLTESRTVDSDFTPEYLETDNELVAETQTEVRR